MKITLDLSPDLLEVAMELNLTQEIPLQKYIRASIRLMNKVQEKTDKDIHFGFGSGDNFRRYNTEISISGCFEE